MVFDHTMSWLVPQGTFLYANTHIIGRICAPIICYLIAEGYYYTRNIRKYMLRLFIFAVISHIPYTYLFGLSYFKATSIMWGLLLGLVALHVYESKQPMLLKIVLIAVICYLARPADWHYITVLWILGFGLFRGHLKRQLLVFLAVGIFIYALPKFLVNPLYYYRFFIILAIPFIMLYNGKRGKVSKQLQLLLYIFYPLHLSILAFLKVLLR